LYIISGAIFLSFAVKIVLIHLPEYATAFAYLLLSISAASCWFASAAYSLLVEDDTGDSAASLHLRANWSNLLAAAFTGMLAIIQYLPVSHS
jgi:hypothetical protein